MPDDTSKVWVDVSFSETLETNRDVLVSLDLGSAENIGGYSIPVIYIAEEVEYDEYDVEVEYYQETYAINELKIVPNEYFYFPPPLNDAVITSLVELSLGDDTISGTNNTTAVYETGYSSISGSIDSSVTFIGGNNFPGFYETPVYFWNQPPASGILEYWVNHTNFCGSYSSGQTPIPTHEAELSYLAQYGTTASGITPAAIDIIVDITFAGWVDWIFYADVYSTILHFDDYFNIEANTIIGGLLPLNLDVTAAALTVSGTTCDLYCTLLSNDYIDAEMEVIPGGIGYIRNDVYSALEKVVGIALNVDLYSLKISNFSLDEGEYTTASGFISVDITDDECPVSTSGTYFMVDDQQVPVTFSPISDGYRMFYNPDDDFSSIEGPAIFTVHAENTCDKYLEVDYYLTFGYLVEYFNHPGLNTNIDYGFNNKVVVRVTAEDYASCPQLSSLAWDFESKELYNNDLSASINGRFHAYDYEELNASISPISTAYFYGKEISVVVNAKDFAGNQMEPLVLVYRIENKP